jgi:hypothetical protein
MLYQEAKKINKILEGKMSAIIEKTQDEINAEVIALAIKIKTLVNEYVKRGDFITYSTSVDDSNTCVDRNIDCRYLIARRAITLLSITIPHSAYNTNYTIEFVKNTTLGI